MNIILNIYCMLSSYSCFENILWVQKMRIFYIHVQVILNVHIFFTNRNNRELQNTREYPSANNLFVKNIQCIEKENAYQMLFPSSNKSFVMYFNIQCMKICFFLLQIHNMSVKQIWSSHMFDINSNVIVCSLIA